MGFLDHLFKPKPSEEKMGEGEKAAAGNEKNAGTAPDPGAFLHPKRFGLRGGGGSFQPGIPGVPHEKNSGKTRAAAERGREIVITLGDVLSRIPTQLLHAGFHDANRELRFSVDDLSADIARGRAAVPLSKIAALCPDVFVREIAPADDTEIRLPLQKLVEQIGLLRGRRAVPPAAPPPGAEAALAKDSTPPDEPASSFGEEQIQLGLAAILSGCPPEIIVGKLPHIDESVRITLPYAPIERQFANECVEVSARRFVSVLPRELQQHFNPRDGVKVPLPIEEILKNLPNLPEPAPVQVPAADAAPPAPADPVVPELHIFTPPPPAVVAAPTAPAENVIGHLDRCVIAEAPPPASATADVQVHPPPVVRPILVHPPPILAASPAQPPGSGDSASEEKITAAPEAKPAPFPQEALQTLFMTDESLDLAAVSRLAAGLPGVHACALDWRGEMANAGALPEDFSFTALQAAAARLSDAARDAGPLPLGTLQNVTLHGDQAAISLFARPGVLLAVWHRALPPGVRERLATVADELARG